MKGSQGGPHGMFASKGSCLPRKGGWHVSTTQTQRQESKSETPNASEPSWNVRSRAWRQSPSQPLGRRAREEPHAGGQGCICISAFKQGESILGCLHFWMKRRLYMRACDTCIYVHRGGGLGMLFSFISPLARRKVLKYRSIPGEWV